MSIRQLSLLRWVMRFDLEVHTEPYVESFNEDEAAFLRAYGIDIDLRKALAEHETDGGR